VSTLNIVKQIRCETRKAVFDTAVRWLVYDDNVDDVSREIGVSFNGTGRSIEQFRPTLFKGRVRQIFDMFWKTGVAYNYSFEMTETNNFNAEINLLKPFTDSANRLGLKAGSDRQRQNTRTFTVTDTFASLMSDVRDDYCTGRVVTANYSYPIAGRIGMDEVIATFVNLTLHGGLDADPQKPSGPPTMVDALEFMTAVSGSATPTVVFEPLGKNLRIANASLTADLRRKDLHRVTVGLALEKAVKAQLGDVRGALYANTFFGSLLTASGGSTERAAAEAVNQVLTQQALSRTILINQ
jgi:hypothetical protein